MRISPRLARFGALVLLLAAPAVHAAADEDAPAAIVFHEDLVIGLDPDAAIGRVTDIAVDSSGVVYVLDTGFMTIHEFDADGAHLGDIGRQGEAPGEFITPVHMALGPEGDIYLAEGRTNITVIHPDGTPGPKFRRHVPSIPRSICVDETGRIFVSSFDEANQTVIQRYGGGDFSFEGSFGDSYAAGRDVNRIVQMAYAGGWLDIAPDGTIVYAQFAPQLLRVFSPEGEVLRTIPARRDETPVPDPIITDEGITFTTSSMTTTVLALEDGTYLTGVWFPEEDDGDHHTLVDVYDAAGRRVATSTEDGWFGPQCRDAEGRLYAGGVKEVGEDEEVPVVVRYRMEIVPPER